MAKMSLAAARVNAGLTQMDVCKKVGVCKNTLIDWEKGRKFPTKEQLEKYCSACNCTVADVDCKMVVIQSA